MKTNKFILFCFIIVVLIVSVLLFLRSRDSQSQRTDETEETNIVSTTSRIATNSSFLNSNSPISTNEAIQGGIAAIAGAYKQGKIGKDQAIQETLREENQRSLDFYGKVIDQYGQSVVGAKIKGTVLLNANLVRSADEVHYTETDPEGNFSFIGLHGVQIGAWPAKEGYKMGGRGEGYQAPAGGQSSPNNRAILTMWKLRGPELLNNSVIGAKTPHDGTPITFDIASGKQSSIGNFRVTLSQYPLEVAKGWEKFDWSVKIEILNGGLVEENDDYPYWAPAEGYQPSFEFNESTNAAKWYGGLQKKFYIKTEQGQYGLMQLKVFPGRSPTGLEADFTINPSGSQNLEPKE